MGYSKNWLLDINGVPCNIFVGKDVDQGPTESHPADGRRATVTFLCAWEDRLDLVAGLVGTVDYRGGAIVRTPPYAYPIEPRNHADVVPGTVLPLRTFCTSIVGIRGEGWISDYDGGVTGTAGWGYFKLAYVTAEFTTPPYLIEQVGGGAGFNDLLQQPYCITKTEVSGEVFAPPSGSYIYNGGAYNGRPLEDVSATTVRCRYALCSTRVRLPIVPTTTINQMIGSVNAVGMTVGSASIDPGAALFTGANPVPRNDPYNGGIVHDVELTWLCNALNPILGVPTNWNYFMDPKGAWVPVVNKSSGDPVFPSKDHSVLFSDTVI